jgi:hypothetical protein
VILRKSHSKCTIALTALRYVTRNYNQLATTIRTAISL